MASSNFGNTIFTVTAGSSVGSGDLLLRNQLTALVVDNSEATRLIHRTYLTTLGVDCWEAETGLQVVEIFETRLISFDLILMDYDLPILDGLETTRYLRGLGVRTMIVGVAGRSSESEIQAFMESGIDEYHEKPLTRAKLISMLRDIDDDK